MSDVHEVCVPQVNVNDETVRLIRWVARDGAEIQQGDAICEIETSKANTDVVAEWPGVLLRVAAEDAVLPIGARLGWIGPTRAAVEAVAARETAAAHRVGAAVPAATPRAAALAEQQGVALEVIAAAGVRGTIKEADVQRFLAERGDLRPFAPGDAVPAMLVERFLQPRRDLSRHERAVIDSLRASTGSLLLATVETDVELTAAQQRIADAQRGGAMVTLLHVVLAASARVLRRHDSLTDVRAGQLVYRYRAMDVAFVMRTPDGRLFTPVVRGADRLDLEAIARRCHAAAIRVTRGTIEPEELEGACFTVSNITDPTLTRFSALPNRFQSSILAAAGERLEPRVKDGRIVPIPLVSMTLTYDHGLCDAVYAAAFLADLKRELEAP